MTTVLKRSPAKRRGHSTQITSRDLDALHRDIAVPRPLTHARCQSTTSVLPIADRHWRPVLHLPNVESSHILTELVTSELHYVNELRSIYSTIIQPYRLGKIGSVELPDAAPKAVDATAKTSPKKHSRSSSLFSLKSERDARTGSPLRNLQHRLRDPMQPESDHLKRSFLSIQAMIKSHAAMLSAFQDSRTPQELISAFIVHIETGFLTYRAFVLTLPYISNLLPIADDLLPNKLSGYSRFLGPMQRVFKYELLLGRLAKALSKESGSRELQKVVKIAWHKAQFFCNTLETAQNSEQAKLYLAELSVRLGTDVNHKTLLFEGQVVAEALSSKKACKINYAILFTDATVFWNSTPLDQVRTPKSWLTETFTGAEDGGCLDLIVHTTVQKGDKTKAVRRAIGFTTVSRPSSILVSPSILTEKKKNASIITNIVELTANKGDKRRRKESIIEDWLELGRLMERRRLASTGPLES